LLSVRDSPGSPPSSDAPDPEQRTTRYRVREKLAQGGMGTVYRVLDGTTGQELALKRISHGAAQSQFLIEAFEREYQILASLNHPRIIRVFDYGKDQIGPYYTMELLEGQDLRRAAPVPYREACLYLRDVATCLALLHARRLIHRDLSPSNVRKTADGHVKLLDFGALMSFGLAEAVVGTPPVVAPEALERCPLDQRTDLFALGALAYWVLTAQHAFPARELHDLYELWTHPVIPPSAIMDGVPPELEALVLSLLSIDPLARPGSAAEVIARLNVIAELPEEDTTEAEQLAQSFLLNPRFTGRIEQLATVQALTEAAAAGEGAAVRIEAGSGMGRTRLLEEIAVSAQLAGATVLRIDASMYRSVQGTSRALALRMFEASPEPARDRAAHFAAPLRALGESVEEQIGTGATPASPANTEQELKASLEGWFADISRQKPLAILVDNVEYADDSSLGLLASLAKLSFKNPLLIVVTERSGREAPPAMGLLQLRAHAKRVELPAFTSDEIFDLTRSLFGDAPNVKRFAEWLSGRSAGSPLHAVEIVRQLIAKEVIRYSGGIWTLPIDRPDASLPAALEDVLSMRIAALSDPARALAECLSLQREQPTLELCRLIVQASDDRELFRLLDELTRNDVLHADRDGYRFTSMALCDVLLTGMNAKRLEQNHKRLGEAFAALAGESDPALKLDAGWHLIQGADEARGADMIASVAWGAVTVRTLLANLHRAGRALEAALLVYGRHRRSIYERMPLLAALAQAGYYEERSWGERYGDAALDALEDISGLRSARRLRRFFGRKLGLVFGILFAVVRFQFLPKSERRYSFATVLIHLFGAVTTLAATAALSLDAERAAKVADVLEPFSVLPARLTPVGIYEFCKGLGEIGRDNEAAAYETFEKLLQRFEDPRYYPTLPADARKIYVAAAHFARSSFAVFRARAEAALESADALERTGFRLYGMIASQVRFLYHMNRGEFAKAAPHREQVELHAAHLGSLWQVETWEAPALILVHTTLSDIVSSTRISHRMELLSRSVPSLKRYSRLAQEGLMRSRGDPRYTALVGDDYMSDAPRSYIGWGATMAFLARGYNEIGQYDKAKRVCESTLAHLTDADREYTAHFLGLDMQLAIAEAGLGNPDQGMARVDGLLERFADCDHPLVHGLLHEVRARISFLTGNIPEYERSLAQVEHRFFQTGTPILIAKCKRLAELKQQSLAPASSAPRLAARHYSTHATVQSDALTEAEDMFKTRTLCDVG
jgi:hypothetical protein